jgi:hypothetical protein
MRLSDDDIHDIAETVAALIRTADNNSCAVLSLVDGAINGKCAKGCEIVVQPDCVAVSGELLWIDDHLLDDDTVRLQFRDALRRVLLPLVKGIGEFRFIRQKSFDGFIILPDIPSEVGSFSQVSSPSVSVENASPSA